MNRSEARSDPRAEGGGSGQSPAKAAMARVQSALADARRRTELDDTPQPTAPRRSSQTPQQGRLADAMDGGVDLGGTSASPGSFQGTGVVQRAISGLTRNDNAAQTGSGTNMEEEKNSQDESPALGPFPISA